MKKHILILSAIVALAACTKEVAPVASPSTVTTFTGEALTTKITLGEKDGSAYKALWAEGDSLAIVDATSGTQLGVAKLQSGAGANKGTFATTAEIANGTSVKLVYGPAAVPADQVQAQAGACNLEGISRASSESIPFIKGGNIAFALSHSSALLKVTVSSSDYAAFNLKSVSVYSKGAAVTGTDVEYAEVTLATPASLATPQVVWLATNGVETASEFYVAATVVGKVDDTPDASVTIPVKFEGKTLAAGKVNTIAMTDLTLAKNPIAWYNPICKRVVPLQGWAYGESNTVVMDPTVGASVTYDLRACGNFVNVMRYAKEPKKVQCRIADCKNTGTWNTWAVDGTTTSNNGKIALSNYAPVISIKNAIASSKPSVAGIFNILDAEDKVIWAFTVWGTKYSSNVYPCGLEVMDQNIGGSASSSAADVQRGLYYQWGRPFPFGYGSTIQVKDLTFKVTSLAESAAHANSVATISDSNISTDWMYPDVAASSSLHAKDLWGNAECTKASKAGEKTIFDPCPKGWMVVAPAVLGDVLENGSFVTSPGNGVKMPLGGDKYDFYHCAAFYNGGGSSAGNRGSNKGQYFCNTPTATGDRAILLEIPASAPTEETPIKLSEGAWRCNASSVRCMKDADNR